MLREERFNKADRIIAVGFWANAGLMIMKLLAGYFGKSEAVFADGLESACDFIAILSTMIALKVGRQPFDPKHPYGHGKAESIAAVLVSLVIFSTGIGILVKAVHTIMDRTYQTPDLIAVLAALVTIAVKEWLYRYTVSTGKHLESPALAAVAKDHRKDAVTSIATLVGVFGAYLGAGVMDPLAAGLTAFFIFHIGYETCMGAIHDLMDGLPSGDLIQSISEVAEAVDGVEHVHEIRGRRSGQYIIIDLKLDMDPEMTVKRSHDIATTVKRLIFEQFPNVGDVMIHINPHDEEHEDLIRL
ncbi:cation diffusion facilitator family transporter [Geobacter metallireducens RCH3]|uniref:Iron/zinc/nickel/cobalt/cadmium efflux protein n=1 Tax=Geobacter metallireducens (strain ATCC 53774 / DSM 7210 / GS-15) TaxID=269799 RepID=Q39XC4_GEOMG|nr:cation diffusion facilitator family transporter [Geobacter metallireducens]ABB31100.1 iron/zinc/nickel/cobalt/cadmium efflux protein [Geobacter metallireducens GS-15]EHP86880.1 cation diffusion facilitator family transporter [Geobacter metallireducens RCH3]